ncbi:tRNA (N6-isopentenyl adenosine(37)-C2)-methylthiotransferase MiaB [Candidatus Gracilibacteria bacterium]|nr:tRNA (N6-isopentenyl adenosine(37)-C2)-methylthiotransferase MiaB [Candidatus Gracilibacteria bacterium]MCF7897103.1 tRNA (N6-isopentenyl adenosine(37)-C2)-methylthiotransferase MiaB [Candidatus Gracilibacteria bacterium]
MKYFFRIFGCAMNYADAERVASVLADLNFEPAENLEEADLVLLFTCSVRQKSEDKVFGELENFRKWKTLKAGRRIGLTGCMVRKTSCQNSEKKDIILHRGPALDFVWRIEDSKSLHQFLTDSSANWKLETGNFFFIQPKHSNPAQVCIPISTGCDNFCSYCIVPYARGKEVSRPTEEILSECENAVKNGASEITLLGQNVNSWQKQKGAFAKLLNQVAQISKLKRIRFISSHPKDFDESVINVMAANENIERHLHLPAQHGDDEILRKMNRNYTAAHYLQLVEKFRDQLPDASITTDFIVGFPGETDANFENLLKFYKKANFDFAYFAKYSPRPETPAASFENQVPEVIKKERFKKLNDLVVATTAKKYAALKDKTLEILVERCVKNICEGRSSESYLTKFEGNETLIGKMVKVKIIKPREVELWGEEI